MDLRRTFFAMLSLFMKKKKVWQWQSWFGRNTALQRTGKIGKQNWRSKLSNQGKAMFSYCTGCNSLMSQLWRCPLTRFINDISLYLLATLEIAISYNRCCMLMCMLIYIIYTVYMSFRLPQNRLFKKKKNQINDSHTILFSAETFWGRISSHLNGHFPT